MELGSRPRSPRPRSKKSEPRSVGRTTFIGVLVLCILVLWTIGGWVVLGRLGCQTLSSSGGLHSSPSSSTSSSFSSSHTSSISGSNDGRNELLSGEELQKRNDIHEQLVQAMATGVGGGDSQEKTILDKLQELERLKKSQEERETYLRSQEEKIAQEKLQNEQETKRLREDIKMLETQKKELEKQKEAASLRAAKAEQEASKLAKKEEAIPEDKQHGNLRAERQLPDLVQFVDVRRGTDNKDWRSLSHGNALPIISRPLGMTHWSIENSGVTPWFFNPSKPQFSGIRCTHQPSPWIGDYGYFKVLPIIDNQREATYDAKEAVLNPSYMRLKLTSQCSGSACTTVEFVGTKHGGIMRVSYPQGVSQKQGLRFTYLENLEGMVSESRALIEVKGSSKKTTVFQAPRTMRHYMVAKIEFAGDGAEGLNIDTRGQMVTWTAKKQQNEVLVKFGTSFISYDQAKLNMQREVESHSSLEGVKHEGWLEWNQLLSRVEVEADSTQTDVQELKTTLYSCLYRGLLFPRQLGEVNSKGELVHYSPYDTTGRTYSGPLSTDSGFWDAYRAVYPMLHLVYPDLVTDVMEGWVNAIREDPDQMLVQWSSPGRVGSMVGSMGEVSMAEAIVNGALGEQSVKDAYEYMKRSALQVAKQGREHMQEYLKYGYVPAAPRRGSTVSLTLNYILSDYAVSQAAEFLGDMETANTLRARSDNWKKIFDSEKLFFREKDAQGKWREPFDEFLWMGPYTEGGAWQYRFYVPHDPKGLRDMYEKQASFLGRSTKMCSVLDQMMTVKGRVSNRDKIHEELEMLEHSFGQYAHNNQPVHHVLYMFPGAGCATEGQKWIHHTLRTQYGPFGYAGDEDNGEMSSWYILSSFGLYALVPGSGNYQVGAPPLFKKVTIHRGSRGADLVIERENGLSVSATPKSSFTPAKSVRWNGRTFDLEHDAVKIPYKELLQGGTLTFMA